MKMDAPSLTKILHSAILMQRATMMEKKPPVFVINILKEMEHRDVFTYMYIDAVHVIYT